MPTWPCFSSEWANPDSLEGVHVCTGRSCWVGFVSDLATRGFESFGYPGAKLNVQKSFSYVLSDSYQCLFHLNLKCFSETVFAKQSPVLAAECWLMVLGT